MVEGEPKTTKDLTLTFHHYSLLQVVLELPKANDSGSSTDLGQLERALFMFSVERCSVFTFDLLSPPRPPLQDCGLEAE